MLRLFAFALPFFTLLAETFKTPVETRLAIVGADTRRTIKE
jgi:hypothetical protein